MAAFSWYGECDGNDVVLNDIFDNAIKNVNTDYVYWGVLVKDYFGKNIEIKITDIEKDKKYRERGVVK